MAKPDRRLIGCPFGERDFAQKPAALNREERKVCRARRDVHLLEDGPRSLPISKCEIGLSQQQWHDCPRGPMSGGLQQRLDLCEDLDAPASFACRAKDA